MRPAFSRDADGAVCVDASWPDDVRATYRWLTQTGFEVQGSEGSAATGEQLELSDGQSRVWIVRDKSQWMIDLQADGWAARTHFGLLIAATLLAHLPTDPTVGPLPIQLPLNEVWASRLPEVLSWAAGQPHRSVFCDLERQHHGTRFSGGGGEPPPLEQIEAWVRVLAAAIDAPAGYLPTYETSEDFARPHVEVDGDTMAWVVVERGLERVRYKFTETIDLMEHIFRGVTFSMAADWEVEHRDPAADFRLRLWAKQQVLLEHLHPQWAQRHAEFESARFREVGLDPAAAGHIVADAD